MKTEADRAERLQKNHGQTNNSLITNFKNRQLKINLCLDKQELVVFPLRY